MDGRVITSTNFCIPQAVCTVTFTVEADVIEERLDEWLQVSLSWLQRNTWWYSLKGRSTFVGPFLLVNFYPGSIVGEDVE